MQTANAKSSVHPTAIISPGAELGSGVVVGPFSIVEDDVEIGDGTIIHSHAKLESGARIGKNCKIFHGAVLAGKPQDLKFENEKTYARIGDHTTIREYVTVNRGTKHRGETTVGDNCLLMAYSHVAHDCILGNNVIMANSVNLAGHVEIQDFAIVGGVVPVHQFTRIGCHSIIGGGFRVAQDVCPYMLAAGYPLKIYGLNRVGLTRRGFSAETIELLDKAHRIMFRSRLNTSTAVARIRQELEPAPEMEKLLTFIESSERGLVK